MPLKLISSLTDTFKLGLGAVAGGALVGGGLLLWFNVWALPAAEQAAEQAGFERCRVEVDEARVAELQRQRAANDAAREEAEERIADLSQQNDDLNEQLLDLSDAINSDPGSADACIGPERVRDLDAIR